MSSDTIQPLRCSICGKIIAEVQNGTILIKARHNGEQHTTAFSLIDLVRDAYGPAVARAFILSVMMVDVLEEMEKGAA